MRVSSRIILIYLFFIFRVDFKYQQMKNKEYVEHYWNWLKFIEMPSQQKSSFPFYTYWYWRYSNAQNKVFFFINKCCWFTSFRSSECDVVRGECTQTYVPYLFLVIPLGPVTLTGQDYVLVESGCVCKPKYATELSLESKVSPWFSEMHSSEKLNVISNKWAKKMDKNS